MKEMLVLFALSIFFAVLASLSQKSSRPTETLKPAMAVITNVSETETNIRYHVRFDDAGVTYNGKSISYPASGKSYGVGEKVRIGYYITKAGWPQVEIYDDELVPSRASGKTVATGLRFVSICFLVAAIICAVLNFLR